MTEANNNTKVLNLEQIVKTTDWSSCRKYSCGENNDDTDDDTDVEKIKIYLEVFKKDGKYILEKGNGYKVKNKKSQSQQKKLTSEGQAKKYGKFIFGFANPNELEYTDFTNVHLINTILVATCINYDGSISNRLKRPLLKSGIAGCTGLKEYVVSNTLGYGIDNKIMSYSKAKNVYSVSQNMFFKGELNASGVDWGENMPYRIHREGTRSLTVNSNYSNAAHLFRGMFLVNKKYNILCYDTDSENLESIQPLNMSEFCREIGYSDKNADRLFSALSSIKISPDGLNYEPILKRVVIEKKKYLIINPFLFYMGSNLDVVMGLGDFYMDGLTESENSEVCQRRLANSQIK